MRVKQETVKQVRESGVEQSGVTKKIAQQGNVKQHLSITLFERNEGGLFENEKHFRTPATMHVQNAHAHTRSSE